MKPELLILFYSWGNRNIKVLRFTQSHRERWYQSPVRFSQSWPSRQFLECGFLKGRKVLTYKTLRNVWEYQQPRCMEVQKQCQGFYKEIGHLLLLLLFMGRGLYVIYKGQQVAQSLAHNRCSVNSFVHFLNKICIKFLQYSRYSP